MGLDWIRNKHVALAISGIILSFLGGAMLFMSSIPWLGFSDTSLHLDYSWQVYKGQLPDFYEGAESPMKIGQPPVHYVAQHPPLYYAILAPITGSLIDSGYWKIAVVAASLVTMIMGLLCLLSFAWLGWVNGGKRREQFAVAVPAIVATTTPFLFLSSTIFNDMLLLLFSVLALIQVSIIIRQGITTKNVVLLALFSLLGMASRASFIGVLAVVALSIPIAIFLHEKRIKPARDLKRIVLYELIIGSVIAVGIGWFYYRNFKLSGDWTSVAPSDWPRDILGRTYKPFKSVLLNSDFLLLLPKNMYGRPGAAAGFTFFSAVSTAIFTAGVLAASFAVARQKLWLKLKDPNTVLVLLSILLFGLFMGQQLIHAVGYGGLIIRYVMPVWASLGILLAFACLSVKKFKTLSVMGLVLFGWIALFSTILGYIQTRWAARAPGKHGLELMQHFITEVNHLPVFVLPICLLLIVAGFAIQGYYLSRIVSGKSSPKGVTV